MLLGSHYSLHHCRESGLCRAVTLSPALPLPLTSHALVLEILHRPASLHIVVRLVAAATAAQPTLEPLSVERRRSKHVHEITV